MARIRRPFVLLGVLALAPLAAFTDDDDNPRFNPSHFVRVINNPYYPLRPGTTFYYTSETDQGTETEQVAVTHDTRLILGVTAVVVHDQVFLDGDLTEDTLDWYAQAAGGIVADSEAGAEYQETVNKAAALGRAIEVAEGAFGKA